MADDAGDSETLLRRWEEGDEDVEAGKSEREEAIGGRSCNVTPEVDIVLLAAICSAHD